VGSIEYEQAGIPVHTSPGVAEAVAGLTLVLVIVAEEVAMVRVGVVSVMAAVPTEAEDVPISPSGQPRIFPFGSSFSTDIL
jgi:hypothetical protein